MMILKINKHHLFNPSNQMFISLFILKHTLMHSNPKSSVVILVRFATPESQAHTDTHTHTLQLYCSSRPAPTVIDRCLQSHSAKSDMRHMGVPPSCHVHLPMSLLWLRWRWQEQSGACQSDRNSLAPTDSFPLPYRNNSHTLSLSTPWCCVSAVINFPDFQWAGGASPHSRPPSQVTLTGCLMPGMPSSQLEVSIL